MAGPVKACPPRSQRSRQVTAEKTALSATRDSIGPGGIRPSFPRRRTPMRHVWTGDERRLLAERYAAEGAVAIAAQLGRSADSVSSQARRYGIRSPDYRARQARSRAVASKTVDMKFLETDTPENAFVAGYIWACGSLRTTYRAVLRASCPRGDLDGLRKVRTLLKSQNLIQTYENRHVLEICNSVFVETFLKRFGMPPGRKTDGDPPKIASTFLSRFAAGYLAGAGSRSEAHVLFVGHRTVIQWLAPGIMAQVDVPEPVLNADLARHSIRWADPRSVRAIGAWLKG